MKLESLFSFFETYVNRLRIRRFVNRLEKLPKWIDRSNMPQHNRVALDKALKLAVLQMFKPKTEKQRREFLKK